MPAEALMPSQIRFLTQNSLYQLRHSALPCQRGSRLPQYHTVWCRTLHYLVQLKALRQSRCRGRLLV